MLIQVTLTVHESKRVIAKGIVRLPVVREALRSGKILLKGGTTVSAVCEELVGRPLRISGRIVPSGAKAAQALSAGFHSVLIEHGECVDVDDSLEQAIEGLGAEDVAILGANAIDPYGNAALMYGTPLGGKPGRIISGLMAEIKNVLIAAGLEKLVPDPLPEIIKRYGRKDIDLSMGIAVGLTPLTGTIITEREAIPLLAEVSCSVIGMGGIFGAEGATTMIIEGEKEEVEKVFQIIASIKGEKVSGIQESLIECEFPNERCKLHPTCIYKRSKKQ
jgi:hypothetical protein